MKLKDYIKQLKKLESRYGNAELYYSIDDEGNGYDAVKFGPGVMYIAKKDIPKFGNIDPICIHEHKESDNDISIVVIN